MEISRIIRVTILCGGVNRSLCAAMGTVCVPRRQKTRSAVDREPSSFSVNITRPECRYRRGDIRPVSFAIGGETSVSMWTVTVAAVDNKLSALTQTQSVHHVTRPQFGATLPPQRVYHVEQNYDSNHQIDVLIKALKD